MYFSLKNNKLPVDMKHKKERKKERLIEAESIYKNIALEKKEKHTDPVQNDR